MIVTVTLNAAIDRTLLVPNFQLGQRHRASASLSSAGGKGINVARALKRLGVPVVCAGLAGGRTGVQIVERLTSEGLLNDFVRIKGESRTSTAVVDPTSNVYTEINEWGPEVEEHELAILRDKLAYLTRGAEFVVFAGSLPRGVETDAYATFVRELRKLGVTTIVDTDGEPLRQAVRAEPTIISPNVNEAEELVGHEFNDEQDMIFAIRELGQLGPRESMMTTPDGCFACLQGDTGPVLYRARIEPREAVATVGSGDAFLAGFVAARYEGRPPEDCLRFGVACGADSTQRLGAGLIDPREVERLVPEVEVERVAEAAAA
jgi:1-phosphofructokinase/tagatose 6-phosphate kinase